MQNIRPTATSFSTIVANLAYTFICKDAGYWTSFMAGSAPVDVTVANPGQTMFLYLDEAENVADVDRRAGYLDTVGIVANTDQDEPERWDVIDGRMFEGRYVAIASFKTEDAALGFALERVCARNWYAGAQDAHDPVAV